MAKKGAKDDGFREDLIIANDDGYLYHINQKDLKHGKNAKGESFRVDPKKMSAKEYKCQYGIVLDLLSRGMVVAAVPPQADAKRADVTVMPIMCYILNVDALKHYNQWDPKETDAPSRKPKAGDAEA